MSKWDELMFLNHFYGSDIDKKYQKLSESLDKDFGVDVSIYEDLSQLELAQFVHDLEYKKAKIIAESDFNSYYSDPEYTRTSLLIEAIRIILREISPKRIMKRKKYSEDLDETLDYKIDPPTSAAIDHDIDEDEERPDLYWRKHQWEEERTQENHPVTVHDAEDVEYGENPDNTNRVIPSYAKNAQPVGGTAENEQQAGIYVAVMDPNRFLGDKESQVMSIEPSVKSQNETSPLTRKISDVMIDAEDPIQGTEFEIAGNKDAALQGKAPSKVVAVYEDDEELNEEGEDMSKSNEPKGGLVEGLGTLLEGELERAELVLATKDLVGRLQKMIEDLGKMGTDDIMPLVDGLRTHFGPEVAEAFSQKAEQHIQDAANSVQSMKDTLDAESERLEGRISDEDAETPMSDMAADDIEGTEPEAGELASAPLDAIDDEEIVEPEQGDDEDLGDLLGGEEEDESEPLGRSKKESHVVTIAGKKVRLSEAQIKALRQAKAITAKINALAESEKTKPSHIDFVFSGVRFRLNEQQVKDLIFAKNFNRLVESKKAKVAKLSENQANMLTRAKKLTERIRQLVNEKWGKSTDTPKSERGKYSGKTEAELKSMLSKLKKSGPHKKGSDAYERQNEIEFALRSKHGWGKVPESKLEEKKWIKTNPAEKGKYDGKNLADLKKMKTALKKDNDKYQEKGKKVPQKNKDKMAELNFAIRAKEGHGFKGD